MNRLGIIEVSNAGIKLLLLFSDEVPAVSPEPLHSLGFLLEGVLLLGDRLVRAATRSFFRR